MREQKIALGDFLPVLEMHGLELACHARADFDRIHRHEAADIFILVSDRLLDRLGDRHRRRRRCGLLLVLTAGRQHGASGSHKAIKREELKEIIGVLIRRARRSHKGRRSMPAVKGAVPAGRRKAASHCRPNSARMTPP